MKTNGLNRIIRRFRLLLGNWILPNMSLKRYSEIDLRRLVVSSYTKGDKIPIEHYEKVWMEMFKLVESNTIYDLKGFKRGNIFETNIFYVSKKVLFKEDLR